MREWNVRGFTNNLDHTGRDFDSLKDPEMLIGSTDDHHTFSELMIQLCENLFGQENNKIENN